MPKISKKEVIRMEKNISDKILRWGLGILGVLFAMYICASASYYFVRKKAPSQEHESAKSFQDNNPSSEDKPFPNLPVAISGTYSTDTDLEPTDTNDYLMVCEGELVNLYTINKDGDQIFEKVLDIDISSLKEEDKDLLTSGILVDSKDDILSLIEDFSS